MKKLTYEEKLAKYKEDLKQWKEEEAARKKVGMKSEPPPKKPIEKAPVKKAPAKKEPSKSLSKKEFAALSLDGKIAYYRRVREDLINKVQDKLTQKELDSVGADFLDPKINKKITPAEASLIKNIDKQINQITRESKKLKEEGELFTWTRRGVGNQKIIEKFPIETVERIKALEPLEQKVEIFKDDPTKLNISDIDSFLAFGKDFGMVISYDVFKEYLLTNKYTIDEMEFMCRGSDRRVQ